MNYGDSLLNTLNIPNFVHGSIADASCRKTYGYDLAGNPVEQWVEANRPSQLTLPGGIVQSTHYDSLMRPRCIHSQKQNNDLILQRECQYSDSGNITQITSEHGVYSYQYDNADRLTQAGYPDNSSDAYSYDPTGKDH